jgi:hypothetical protein
MQNKTKVIRLAESDNVVVCTETIDSGQEIYIENNLLKLLKSVSIGHKLACRQITKGDLIIKYGVPIGTATKDITFGEHVHTHNMKSNYIETHLIK